MMSSYYQIVENSLCVRVAKLLIFYNKFPFTEPEWKAGLKVLSSLKDDPLNNPDNDGLKSLLQNCKEGAKSKW